MAAHDDDEVIENYEVVRSGPRRSGLMTCFDCGREVSTSASACPNCGRPMRQLRAQPQAEYRREMAPVHVHAAPVPQPSGINTNVSVYVPPQPESVTFAVVTLLFWIFFAPVGLLLNLVGLLTGPRRGCFFSMFFLFVLVPVGLVLLLVVTGASIGIPIVDDFARSLK